MEYIKLRLDSAFMTHHIQSDKLTSTFQMTQYDKVVELWKVLVYLKNFYFTLESIEQWLPNKVWFCELTNFKEHKKIRCEIVKDIECSKKKNCKNNVHFSFHIESIEQWLPNDWFCELIWGLLIVELSELVAFQRTQ